MYKKNLVKATSVLTAFALACSTMAGCGLTKKTEDTAQVQDISEDSPEAEELVETMTKTAFTGNKENAESGKEETVYVMTDANGAVDEVVVSNWLKNANGDKSLTDTTNLKDIVNVKGDESFKENGDGTVTWDAEGSDIYYQGTPTEEVPVGVKVTYELDGKQMKAEDIAGKSGSVKIRFDYTNSLKAEATIDGKKENIDVPFTMISGTMLDNEKFANVKVSNGKVISDANNYVVVGVAMPGLKESLKIDDEKLEENDINEEDVDIPDFVEITADVQDFELPMTVSMASANVVSDLGLDKIYNSDKIDDLNGDMDELSDASTQLRDGSGELADGTEKFEDGTTELYDGAGELKDGTGELKSGVGELKDGAGTLKDGTGQLKDGTGELKDGAGQLASGSKELASGASTLSTGIGSYADAVGQIAGGAKDLDKGVGTLKSGASELSNGITSAKGGAEQLKTGAAQLSAGIDTAANTVKAQMDAINSATATFYNEYKAVIDYAASNAGATSSRVYNAGAPSADQATLDALLGQAAERLAALMTIESGSDLEVITVDKPVVEEKNNNDSSENNNSSENTDNNDNNEGSAENNDSQNNDSQNNDSQNNESQNNESQNNDSQNDNSQNDNSQNDNSQNDESQSGDDQNQDNQESDNSSEGENQENNNSSDDSENAANVDNSEAAADDNTVENAEEAVSLEAEQVSDSVNEYASDADWAYIEQNTGISHAQWTMMYQTVIASMQNQPTEQSLKAQCEQLQSAMNEGDKYAASAKTAGEAAAAAEAAAKQAASEAEAAKQAGDYATAQAKAADAKAKAADAQQYYSQYKAAYDAATQYYTAAIKGVADGLTQTKNATQYATTIFMTYKTLSTSADTLGMLYNGTGQGGLKDIQTGASQLAVGANSLYDGMKKLAAGGTSLSEGVGTLKDGTSKLSKGASKLNANSDDLKNGGKKLAEGAGTLAEGAGKLSDGTGKLYDGVVELNDGTGKLYDGVGKLYDGATELDDGVGKLKDGAGELKDGAVELNDGARKLADGMVEFDEDGIQQLTSKVDDGIVSMTDRLKAIDEASQSYTSFSGANADEPSTVQFIIRTAPVKSDKD